MAQPGGFGTGRIPGGSRHTKAMELLRMPGGFYMLAPHAAVGCPGDIALMKRTGLWLAVASVAFLAPLSAALAEDMVVTRDSDVYRDRTGNRVVNEVEEGQIVDVRECRGQRCRIRIPGPDGWVRSNRLVELDEWRFDRDDRRPPRRGDDDDWGDRPGKGGGKGGQGGGKGSGGITITIPLDLGGGQGGKGGGQGGKGGQGQGGQGQGGKGGGHAVQPAPTPAPQEKSQVCLYSEDNRQGDSRCFSSGQRVNLSTVGWDNVAASFDATGKGGKVCDLPNGGGRCVPIRARVNGGDFIGMASYVEVY